MAIQSDILTNFAAKLSELSWPNLVAYDKIRISADDFRNHEIPAIQFWPSSFLHTHVQGRLKTEMEITVEVILRQTSSGVVSINDLMDKMQEVEQKIGENVRLDINGGMIHVKYTSASVDLHMVEPFYIGSLIFVVEFYKPYTGSC